MRSGYRTDHHRQPLYAPAIKRLVDLTNRGPEDDEFTPAESLRTVFWREWPTYHNVVPEVVEIGYEGNAGWGQKISIKLTQREAGDLLQWVALRIKPRSWLGPEIEGLLSSGDWDYKDASGAWMWAASLGTIAISQVEFCVGDTTVETLPGEWLDIWSRLWLDAGRALTWDADLYGQIQAHVMRDTTRPPWTTFMPTEDGYIYCWLPLAFLRRPRTAFPLVSMGETQEVRINVTFRPYSEVIRRRAQPLAAVGETPSGSTIVLEDRSGGTPIPWVYTLPTGVPAWDDMTVLGGVVHTEDPMRSALMRQPQELLYDPVTFMRFDMTNALSKGATVLQSCVLSGLNGPIREIYWVLRRKAVWQYNEWTNYGRRLDPALEESAKNNTIDGLSVQRNRPLLESAQLWVNNALWLDDTEQWWRYANGLAHRGGIRAAGGMVYGYSFGLGGEEELQPGATANASRCEIRLDLTVTSPKDDVAGGCEVDEGRAWEVLVFAVGVNWMRFVSGVAQPLFQD
jgi:hypothetical protein